MDHCENFVDELFGSLSYIPFPDQVSQVPFVDAIWPWTKIGLDYIEAKVGDDLNLLLPEALLSLQNGLVERLSNWCSPTFATEMTLAKLEERLEGITPREQYLDFVHNGLLKKEFLSVIFSKKEDLVRGIYELIALWVEQASELLWRLKEDLELLTDIFSKNAPFSQVQTLKMPMGEYHNKGRTVYQLTFTNGKTLFYKPKDLNIAKDFNALLDFLNEEGLKPNLYSYKILARQGYGWEEKVEHFHCTNKQELESYFERAGQLICLVYLLDGIDFHYENLIPHGEYPALIDVETLFQTYLNSSNWEEASKRFAHSVLNTGFLPKFEYHKSGERVFDMSPFGTKKEEKSEAKVPLWKNINTSEMRFSYVDVQIDISDKLVLYQGKQVVVEDFVESIIKGFRNAYQFLQKRTHLFLSEKGWLYRLSQHPVRQILRPTWYYIHLIQRFALPELQANSELREKEFERLLPMDPKQESLSKLVTEEKSSILQNDVPYFVSYPRLPHIFVGKRLVLENCFHEPCFETVYKRFQQMSESNCQFQENLIRQVYAPKKLLFHGKNSAPENLNIANDASSIKNELLWKETINIAEEILENAFKTESKSLSWLVPRNNPAMEICSLCPMKEDLYGGKMGIALFFAALYSLTNEEKWKDACLNTTQWLCSEIREKNEQSIIAVLGIGGMTGVGGVIYGLCKISKLINTPLLLQDSLQLALALDEKNIEEDEKYDVILGSAGLLLSLLSLYEESPHPEILKHAQKCGDHLCKNAIASPQVSFSENSGKEIRQSGFSHGATGIAYALLKLAFYCKKSVYQDFALAALSYEDSLFSSEEKNWAAFLEGNKIYANSWCYGAPGIGLGRLGSLQFCSARDFSSEVKTAIETTTNHLSMGIKPMSLCCGPFGHCDFLQEASRASFEMPHYMNLDKAIACAFNYYQTAAHTKSQMDFDPSLMQGSSGIGYCFLRYLDKKKILPPILLLS